MLRDMGMMINRRRVCGKKGLLPSGYKQLEYIEGDGTQYGDTGYIPSAHTKAVIECILSSSNNNVPSAILGSRVAYQNNSFTVFNASYYLMFDYGSGRWSATDIQNIDKNAWYRYTLGKVCSCENLTTGVLKTHTFQAHSFNTNKTIGIGSVDAITGWSGKNFKGKYRSIKIYDGMSDNDLTIVQDYVPCKDSNGRAGLYDIINRQMHYSLSGVDWIAGPEV